MLSNRRVFFNTWIEVQLIFPPLDYLARGIARNTNKNSFNGVKPVRKHFYIVWNVCCFHPLTAWERLAFQTIFTDKKLPSCLITHRSLNFLKKNPILPKFSVKDFYSQHHKPSEQPLFMTSFGPMWNLRKMHLLRKRKFLCVAFAGVSSPNFIDSEGLEKRCTG